MITLELIDGPAYIVRWCAGNPDPASNPPFETSGVLEFKRTDPAGTAWAKAFSGTLSPEDMRDLVRELVKLGVTELKAIRMGNHSLPFSKIGPGGERIVDVKRLAGRMLRKRTDNMNPSPEKHGH